MTETEPVADTSPTTEQDAWKYDAMGYCVNCHLPQYSVERVEQLIVTGKAVAVRRFHCGHILIYRSVGLWTEAR